jgi:hypothetical protein
MNGDLRLEYKNAKNDHGHISQEKRKNRYLVWLEDELTKERKQVKKLIIGGVSNQRELLIGFLTELELDGGNKFVSKEWLADEYLKTD